MRETKLDAMMESYIILLREQIKLKKQVEEGEIKIKDIKSAINRDLHQSVGKIARADGRMFCCLRGDYDPIIIEVEMEGGDEPII